MQIWPKSLKAILHCHCGWQRFNGWWWQVLLWHQLEWSKWCKIYPFLHYFVLNHEKICVFYLMECMTVWMHHLGRFFYSNNSENIDTNSDYYRNGKEWFVEKYLKTSFLSVSTWRNFWEKLIKMALDRIKQTNKVWIPIKQNPK